MLKWLRVAVAALFALGVVALAMPEARITLAMVDRPDVEACLVGAVGAERVTAGVGMLTTDEQLMAGARSHASAMATAGDLRHSDRPATYGRHWAALGENVAVNYSCEAMSSALANSPRHRAITVDGRWVFVGAGVVEVDGTLWGAVAFAQPKGGPAVAGVTITTTTTVAPAPTTTRPPPPPALRPPCSCPAP